MFTQSVTPKVKNRMDTTMAKPKKMNFANISAGMARTRAAWFNPKGQ